MVYRLGLPAMKNVLTEGAKGLKNPRSCGKMYLLGSLTWNKAMRVTLCHNCIPIRAQALYHDPVGPCFGDPSNHRDSLRGLSSCTTPRTVTSCRNL